MEKQKFDDSWKDAFQDAEVSPSENVWTNIELDLEKEEGNAMKRKLLFYKTLAAASVIFALAIGGAGVYMLQDNGASGVENIALQTEVVPETNKETGTTQAIQEATTELPDKNLEQPAINSIEKSKAKKEGVITQSEKSETSETTTKEFDAARLESVTKEQHSTGDNTGLLTSSDVKLDQRADVKGYENQGRTIKSSGNVTPPVSGNSEAGGRESVAQLGISHRDLPSLVAIPTVAFKIPVREEPQTDPVALMLAKLEQREIEIKSDKKKKERETASDEDLWTSVGFAAGSFNTTTVSNVTAQPATFSQSARYNSTIATREASASGMAYTVGVNMGKKIAERWIVQGGVNYLTQSSDYTAQSAVGSQDYQSFRPESINELENLNQADYAFSENKVITTAPYNVNNNVKYLSVPIQAGFLVINKKFGLQMNAGISTDLFLQNTKSADAENLNKIEQNIGDNSPYRTMNFSGLLGTEFSYKFTPRYRVILNPGLRYPINSVYKSGLGIESAPLTFDVGLRFRYIFK